MKKIIYFLLLFSCIGFAQQIKVVDFLRCEAELTLLPKKKEVRGVVSYKFRVLKGVDSLFIDSKNMEFDNVHIGKGKVKYKTTKDKLWLLKKFKKNRDYIISFNYSCNPKKAIYFIDWEHQNHPEANPQIWTQGQGKYTSNWLPSIDDMNDKIEFDLSVSFHRDYEVIANGKLVSKKNKNDSVATWRYDMQQPMSSYLVALAIGKYKKKTEKSVSGVLIEMYYYPKDEIKFEPTYRYTKQMFDFLEEEIGVSYPWQNYKQVPVKDFLYAGMENTSTTIFSDAFVVDKTSFIDKNYVNVNAHELAHQWFGNLVTETHGTHHWLHEGFATYYALLAEKEIFGEDYFNYRLFEYGLEIENAQEKDTIPLMNSKASSLTFYKKGALTLYHLRNEIGDSVFRVSVRKYLETHQFKNVETNDFLSIVEQESGIDLFEFKNKWLLSNTISKGKSWRKLISHPKENMDRNSIYSLRHRLKNNTIQLSDSILAIKDLKFRQILSGKLDTIPLEYKKKVESLLKDKSYQTIENTLYNLWVNFPLDRIKYLDQTKDVIGFNDKNVRTLWLTLALNTRGFQKEDYPKFYKELEDYTHPAYHFEVRRNAFQYLSELNLISSTTIKNLQQATKHHNWRFRSYCKRLFNQLTKESN